MRFGLLFFLTYFFACGAPPTSSGSPAEENVAAATTVKEESSRQLSENDAQALDNLIRVTSPGAHSTISSPLTISGEARGTWFFEGDFPVVLYTDEGDILAEGFAHSPEDWMTEGFVSFTVELTFSAPVGTPAKLELLRNNPSDNEDLDQALILPVTID